MKITANRIFACTPLSFQCTDKLQIPRTHSMFYLFVFSTSHLYIYTLCVHLSFPTQLEHAFLFLFFFFCFNVSAAAAAERSLLMYFFFVRDRNPAAGDAHNSPILYTWRHELCQCVRETEGGGLVSLKELKWSPVLQKKRKKIFSWKEKKSFFRCRAIRRRGDVKTRIQLWLNSQRLLV
jgi:hypothetical protein